MGGGRFVLAGTKRLMAVGKPPDEGGWGVGGSLLVGTKRLMAVGKPPDEGGWGVGGSFGPVQSG